MGRIGILVRGAAISFAALAAGHIAQAAQTRYNRVLLISVDGLHAVDLRNYVASHPNGALAALSNHGLTYAYASTSAPSDSFPGLLAQVTGGTAKSHGVFNDASYDRSLFAPGSNCQGPPGAAVSFDESIDNDPTSLAAGGTLGQPLTQINAAKLPLALINGACAPVYPNDFLKTNTIFEVIRSHGGRTAWSDKHPAYDIVNGPSGKGVQDLFTPEVNSNDPLTGQDAAKGFHSIQRNDLRKVNALLNQIAGKDSAGLAKVGAPMIFGMSFQAVSVGQRLALGNKNDPADAGLIGGYADAAGLRPNNGLQSELDFVDAQLGVITAALKAAHLDQGTLVIVSAKHGQSPINQALRKAVDSAPYAETPGIAAYTADDAALIWLAPAQQWQSYLAAKAYLVSQSSALGIVKILDKDDLSRLYRNPFVDNRTPDFILITTPGLIYAGGAKLAEHGGFATDDRNVALLVSNPSIAARTINDAVETRQIAPTILRSLGLDPNELRSVIVESTSELPGLREPGGSR
ncbi:alkaline phosphatase family protein [Methylocapsa aurea]|uniref:alkaline phosphatase family protein n=1 Tax=Methylocapsa aurea TaxID=663610 RepID=UPI00056D0F9C|nr:alkaline phosphatase family protein [Methylocapsa aurea]